MDQISANTVHIFVPLLPSLLLPYLQIIEGAMVVGEGGYAIGEGGRDGCWDFIWA